MILRYWACSRHTPCTPTAGRLRLWRADGHFHSQQHHMRMYSAHTLGEAFINKLLLAIKCVKSNNEREEKY